MQDYIGSAVVEIRVQAASNINKNEMSRACRQNSDLCRVPGPRFALVDGGTSVESVAGVSQRVRNKPLNQIQSITFMDMRGVTWRPSWNL